MSKYYAMLTGISIDIFNEAGTIFVLKCDYCKKELRFPANTSSKPPEGWKIGKLTKDEDVCDICIRK